MQVINLTMKQCSIVCDKCGKKEPLDLQDILGLEDEADVDLPGGWMVVEEMELCPDCYKRYKDMVKRFKEI